MDQSEPLRPGEMGGGRRAHREGEVQEEVRWLPPDLLEPVDIASSSLREVSHVPGAWSCDGALSTTQHVQLIATCASSKLPVRGLCRDSLL